MVEKKMSVSGDPDSFIEFRPRIGAEFNSLDMAIPSLDDHDAEGAFANKLTAEVRRACGNTACSGLVHLSTAGRAGNNIRARVVIGAKISCLDEQCPLIDPPESDDRETQPTGDTPEAATPISNTP